METANDLLKSSTLLYSTMFLGLRAGELLLYRCVVALTCHLKVPSAEGEARVGEEEGVVPKLPPAQAKVAATAPVSKLWELRSTHSLYPT